MAGLINHEARWKKHETKGLFGIIKNLHRKISGSKPTTFFLGHQTVKMFEGYQREFQLQKSKVIAHTSRLQSRLI